MGKGLPRSMRNAKAADAVKISDLRFGQRNFVITNGAPGWGTIPLGQLPQGNILFLGVVTYLKFTKNDADITDTFDGDYALATAPIASGALGSPDLIASTAFAAAASGGATTLMRAASAAGLAGLVVDNTAGDKEINLNVIIDDASISADGALFVEGSVHIAYTALGDD
jgi:hypothetical protein